MFHPLERQNLKLILLHVESGTESYKYLHGKYPLSSLLSTYVYNVI